MASPNAQVQKCHICGILVFIICCYIFNLTISAITGQLFPEKKEAAFAHYNGWRAAANCATYAYGNYLCQTTKIYILLGLCIVGLLSFVSLEILLRTQLKCSVPSVAITKYDPVPDDTTETAC